MGGSTTSISGHLLALRATPPQLSVQLMHNHSSLGVVLRMLLHSFHSHDFPNSQSAYTFLGSFLGAATLGQCHSPLSVGQTIVAKSSFPSANDWEDTTAVVIST